MEPIKRILCPVDFSDTSLNAIAFAERLATSLSAEIILLHVSDREPAYLVVGKETTEDTSIRRQLDNIRLNEPHVAVQRVLHAGAPGEVICWLAENRGCDLIVMGTHGRKGVMHLLLGSVTEYVIRHARSPVVTVREFSTNEPPLKEPVALPVPAPRFM